MTERNLSWKSNSTIVSEQQLFDDVTYKFDEIVEYIQLRLHQNLRSNKNKITLNSIAEWNSSVKEHRHRKYGKCYNFIPHEEILESGVYYIMLKM